MTKELIIIKKSMIGRKEINSVSARELHKFLEVETRFNDWINRRIDEYGFINDIDYLKLSKSDYTGSGQAPIDYFITIDIAKELAMVERNDKGKQARRYFIECEKKLMSLTPNFADPYEAALAWAEEYKQKQLALQQVKQLENDVEEVLFENEELKIQIGNSTEWKQVTAITWLRDFFNLKEKGVWISIGYNLKRISDQMELATYKIPDTKWSEVGIYHVDAIAEFKNKLKRDSHFMRKYRK